MIERTHPRQVRAAFDRAAATYDAAARVQQQICDDLLRLALPHAPASVECLLDAGCGTGRGATAVLERFNPTCSLALDFAPGMLNACASGPWTARLCADLQAMPLAAGRVDLVWSSLAIQWCPPGAALAEIARVLRPGGQAWIATLGPRTLRELVEAFAAVDSARHVIDFHPLERWVQLAAAAGLTVSSTQALERAALSADLRGLLRDIKAIGAHAVGSGRRTRPLGRAAWRTLEARYETHRRADGLLPATYDVILLILRKPA